MGGGGPAPRLGACREADTQAPTSRRTADDELLPDYSEIAPDDEGIDMREADEEEDMPAYAPTLQQTWSFSHLGSISAPHSQMTAVPPSSLDGGDGGTDFFTQEDDLFAAAGADDDASTKAEGGDRSSVEMSDRDEDFVDAPLLEVGGEHRGLRESAPPPLLDDDVDVDDAAELPVAEIRVGDGEEETH
jgi:hypothetical protein